MKTGGFSRFARKPEPKEPAGALSGVGGKSDTMTGQPISSHSDGENLAWGSSDFGSGFGFDSGLDEMSFGGEIVRPASACTGGDVTFFCLTNVFHTAAKRWFSRPKAYGEKWKFPK